MAKRPQADLQLEDDNCIIKPHMVNSPLAAITWARERHSIYLKRNVKGLPKPWTKDPFLSNYRFCNVYRQIDTVSIWVRDHIIRPYEESPQLWYYLAIARCINHIDTLKEIFDANAMQNPEKMYRIMQARMERGEQVFTGAYLINSVFPKDFVGKRQKTWFVAHSTIGGLLDKRKEISPYMKSSLEEAVNALKTSKGMGPFLSYQIAQDLSYSDKWLKNAHDVNSFNSPGPGTIRGLHRLFGGWNRSQGPQRQTPEWYSEKIIELYDMFQDHKYWKITSDDPEKGFAPVTLGNVSNTLCETDKILRLYLKEGEPRSRYQGGQNE